MPSYDYRCNSCKKRVLLTYKTYAEFDRASPACPYCGSTSLTRWITRVALAKSEGRRFGDAETDDSALDELADADPATLGRYMRRMSDETGENLGEEFNEVVERLEKGQSPEEIETVMSPLDGDGGNFGDSLSSLPDSGSADD